MQLHISFHEQYNIKLTINAAIGIRLLFDTRPHIDYCMEYNIKMVVNFESVIYNRNVFFFF